MTDARPISYSLAIVLLAFCTAGPAQAQSTVYVDASASGANDGTSWSDAYTHLQDAFDEVNATFTDHEIRVAAGVYYPDEDADGDHTADDESESFTLDLSSGYAAQIKGGYPAGGGERDPDAYATVLSGDITQDDATNADGVTENASDISGVNSDHVLHIESLVTAETVIDGFAITAGQAGGSSFTEQQGGGLYNEGHPALVEITIVGNRAERDGGGMYNAGGSTTLGSGRAARPTLVNVTFAGNEAGSGGGLYNSGNSGQANLALVNVVFAGNHAELGGALYNGASRGGVSSPTLMGVTFARNTATGLYEGDIPTGGAVHNASRDSSASEPQLVNCILWGNSTDAGSDQVYNDGSGTRLTVSHSTLEGGLGGISENNGSSTNDAGGNLGQDPRFADAASGDLRLEPDSPAIDAGDNSALPPDSLDLDGDGDTGEVLPVDRAGADRMQAVNGSEAVVDMGAYESDGSSVPVEPIARDRPQQLTLRGNAPNPFAGETTIRYELPSAAQVALTVYDVLGREVAMLVDEGQAAGRYEVSFEASRLPAGVYVYRLTTGEVAETGRMVVVK